MLGGSVLFLAGLWMGSYLPIGQITRPKFFAAGELDTTAAAVAALLCGLLAATVIELRRRGHREARRERSALTAALAARDTMEQRLRESEQRLRDIAEVSAEWMWETDADHRFTTVTTDAYIDATGLSPESTIGLTRWELAGAASADDEKWQLHRSDLDAHRPFQGFRYTAALPTGDVRHFAVSGKPVFDHDGTFRGYRGVATNETAMVAALERAETAETLLRDALDSLSEGFAVYDRDDRLVLCNEAYRRMYPACSHLMVPGVPYETLVRTNIASGYFPDAIGHEDEWVAKSQRIHGEATGEMQQQCYDGRWLLISERRMRSGGLACLRIDITEFKRTQIALRESERRLRDFAELASDWFWEQDADARFLWFSDAGGSQELNRSLVGKARWEVSPDGTTPEQWGLHKADIAARRPFRDFRYRRLVDDGRTIHLSIHGLPVFDTAGHFLGYRGIGRDITAQIEAEQELERAKERAEQAETLLRDAVDSISEGFVIYDREDRLVMCNDAYRQIFAESAHLLVPGLRFDDFVRHVVMWGGSAGARGREADYIADRVRHHQSAEGSWENQRASGRVYLSTDRRMKNGGIAGLRVDITALKQAQAALRESEERLDRAQAIAGIGSWEVDLTTGHHIWSRQQYQIRGLDPATFVPTKDSIRPYVLPDDYPAWQLWLANLKTGEGQNVLEARIIRPDGEVRLVRVEGRAMADPSGAIRRLAGTMQDITEQRLIERQLVQAQKMEAIGNLSGGMAHDFNNVLGVIVGNLELLQRLVGRDPVAVEVCAEVLQGASRCAELIRRLLAFARHQSLSPEPTDINALVSDIGRLVGRILGEDIALDLRLDPALHPVVADQPQLEAALVNLASNARDAMPKGGRLVIATRNVVLDGSGTSLPTDVSPGNYVEIQIADTGTGIAPDIINRIFEPFFTTKEPGKGTGLGLAMAFGFAKQSGGHLSVDSKPGVGSTFRLYLPSSLAGLDAADGHVTGQARTEPSTVAGGSESLLVVEDNAPLRQVTVRQLRELGYRVLEAENAADAEAIIAVERVDLLFTDIVMPGSMNGLELAYRCRATQPGVKIVLTSGFPALRGADPQVGKSPFPLLHKPYRRDELAQTLRDVLDNASERATAAMTRRFARAGGNPHSKRHLPSERQ